MKVKAKLDLQAIKNLALEHGEKVAFAIVGLVFLLFVYSAFKRESLSADKQPAQLQAKAAQVPSHVSQSKFAPGDELQLVNYVDRAKREQINLGPYKPPQPLNPLVFDQKAKRDNPTIYPLEELRANAGFGMFALSGAAAGADKAKPGVQAPGAGFAPGQDANIVGRGYTVVTGLVPAKKQSQNYAQLFDAAQGADSATNRPQYLRLIVERAEIDPAQPDKLDWQPVPDSKEFVNRFEATMGDVVPQKYRQDELIATLGPLVRRPWGEAVSHPRIAAAMAQAGDALDAGSQQQQARPQGGGNAAVDQMLADANRRGGRQQPVAVAQPESDVEYRLCRFFDYAVAPKKQYRYRAKAVLQNPNFGVPPQFLAKPETNTTETLETEWSSPSGSVTVPDRYGVLARSVGEKWHRDEPSVKLLATAIDEKAGVEAGADVDVYRASVVNLVAPKVVTTNPKGGSELTLENVDLNTGIVVVDIHGGGPLSKKIGSTVTGPVEVLVMDAQGNLRVHSELEDHASIELLVPDKHEEEAPKKKDDKDKKDDPLEVRKAKGKKPADDRLKGMPPPPGKAKAAKGR